jgi:hypothetical protein
MNMKFNLTICFLAVAMLAFSQKREIQKIEKALTSNNFVEAQKLFSSIDPAVVEDKYKGGYKLAEGMLLLGDLQSSKASLEEVKKANMLIAESVKLGYKSDYTVIAEQLVQNRLYTIAEECLTKKDFKGSAAALEELYLLNPLNLLYANDAANMFYADGDLSKAYEYYNLLVENKFDGVKTKYLAVQATNGTTVEYANQAQRAQDLQLGLATEPKDEVTESVVGDVVLKLVYLKEKLESETAAKDFFKNVQSVYPNDVSLEILTPEIYLQLGMMDEYMATKAALTQGLTDPRVYDKLAEVAQSNSQWDLVIDNYEKSIGLDNQNFPALVNISNALIQKGNLDKITAKEQKELHKKAMAYLEKANIMKPKDENVLATLTQLYTAYKMEDKIAALKEKL